MGAANGVAAHHLIPFGHLILYGDPGIGESAVDPLYRCLHVLGRHFSGLAGGIVKDEIGGQKLVLRSGRLASDVVAMPLLGKVQPTKLQNVTSDRTTTWVGGGYFL